VERVENPKYPDLPTFNVLAGNPDAGKPFVSYSGDYLSVAHGLDCEADARLIAAAPALLAACERLALALEGLRAEGLALGSEFVGAYDAARAAVSLARGERSP
jgi:hypothetical protein